MSLFKPYVWSLAVKLSLSFVSIITGVGFMIGIIVVFQDWIRFNKALEQKALLLSEFVAITTPRAILRNDYWTMHQRIKHLAEKQNKHENSNAVVTAMILDEKGRVQAHLHPEKNPIGLVYSPTDAHEKNFYKLSMQTKSPMVISHGGFTDRGFKEGIVPLFYDHKYMGVVRVRLSILPVYESIKYTSLTLLALLLGLVIFGSILGIVAARRMTSRLTAVTMGLEAVGRGEMTEFSPIAIIDKDEIGRLTLTFNQIMVQLAEKKLIEEESIMNEKLVALGRIAAGVAHEVNNPLAGLINCVDTLRKHPDDKIMMAQYLPVIDQGLHKIKDIVHNLLVGLKFSENHQSVSIAELIRIHDLIKAEIGNKKISLIWNSTLDQTLLISSMIEQVLCNLLKNAVEVLVDKGVITVNIFQVGRYISIEVHDDGPGIPLNIRKMLFDPFFTTKSTGTGLGLWIVYRLVEGMDGVIDVNSDLNKGTDFTVVVPIVDKKDKL
jgi:two-component system, NtrC family, sensor kinase